VLCMAGGDKSLEHAKCARTLWPDGTLFEMVRLNWSNEGSDKVTDEELDRWVEGFPILTELEFATAASVLER
jgi:hypothetical protein